MPRVMCYLCCNNASSSLISWDSLQTNVRAVSREMCISRHTTCSVRQNPACSPVWIATFSTTTSPRRWHCPCLLSSRCSTLWTGNFSIVALLTCLYDVLQTHQSQCLVQDERFKGIECEIFQHPKPSSMALSTLVVIEMLNAMNRLGRRVVGDVGVSCMREVVFISHASTHLHVDRLAGAALPLARFSPAITWLLHLAHLAAIFWPSPCCFSVNFMELSFLTKLFVYPILNFGSCNGFSLKFIAANLKSCEMPFDCFLSQFSLLLNEMFGRWFLQFFRFFTCTWAWHFSAIFISCLWMILFHFLS